VTPTDSRLGRTSAGFALAASVTAVVNTLLAVAKDLSPSLTKGMATLTGHHWTTQGIADLLVFIGLGFLFSISGLAEKIAARWLTLILIASVVASGAGLSIWYILY
jgi:hypothetical protein